MPDAWIKFEMERLSLFRQFAGSILRAVRFVCCVPLFVVSGLQFIMLGYNLNLGGVQPVFITVSVTFAAIQLAFIWAERRLQSYCRDVEQKLKEKEALV